MDIEELKSLEKKLRKYKKKLKNFDVDQSDEEVSVIAPVHDSERPDHNRDEKKEKSMIMDGERDYNHGRPKGKDPRLSTKFKCEHVLGNGVACGKSSQAKYCFTHKNLAIHREECLALGLKLRPKLKPVSRDQPE